MLTNDNNNRQSKKAKLFLKQKTSQNAVVLIVHFNNWPNKY